MSLFKVFQRILLVAIVVAAFAFAIPNAGVQVDLIRLPFLPDRQNMMLIELMLYPLVLGLLAGISFGVLKILELQTRLRSERRTRRKVQGELTALRNLPLDDVEEEERVTSGVDS